MFTRSLTAIPLLLLTAAPVTAADRQERPLPVRAMCGGAQQTGCMNVGVPGNPVLSDHGSDANEAYDREGNPVDRFHNIVAVPGRRGAPREVFATPADIRF